jgi:hypothetical protein
LYVPPSLLKPLFKERALSFFVRITVLLCLCSSVWAGIEVVPEAKHRGEAGLRVSFEDQADQSLRNTSVAGSTSLRVRFYLRLDALVGSGAGGFQLLSGFTNDDLSAFSIGLVNIDNTWFLTTSAGEDGGTQQVLAAMDQLALPNSGWFALELNWQALAGDGILEVMLNNEAGPLLNNLNNGNLSLERISLGAREVAAGVFGYYDLDTFEVRESGEIGLSCFPGAALFGPAAAWPQSHDVRYMITLADEACP